MRQTSSLVFGLIIFLKATGFGSALYAQPTSTPDSGDSQTSTSSPSGYFGIAVDDTDHGNGFLALTPLTIKDAIQTKAILVGLNPLSEGILIPASSTIHPMPLSWVKYGQIAGENTTLWYFLKGKGLRDIMQVSFQQDGTQGYVDIGSMVMNACGNSYNSMINRLQNLSPDYTTCIFVESGKESSRASTSNGKERPFAETIRDYINDKTLPTPTCDDKSSHAGIFALHAINNLGQDFNFPLFHASWTVDHYWLTLPGFGCFHFNDTIKLDLLD